MTKIIGVSGSHGTGKTCTLDNIAKVQSKDPEIVVDDFKVSRAILEEMKCTLDQATATSKLMKVYQSRVLDVKIHRDLHVLRNIVVSTTPINFLVDRSPADVWAYTKLWASKNKVSNSWFAEFTKKCIKAIEQYDKIILFPIGKIPFIDDGVRAKEDTQQCINDYIITFLDASEIKYHTVESATVEDRTKEIISIIGGL